VARGGPPAYAWDWFARQRLLWREVRARLAHVASPVSARYAAFDTRAEVVAMLRADYPREPHVRATVDEVGEELAFLGRTEVPFERLAVTAAPRGMRWWWTAITGEELGAPAGRRAAASARAAQLSLDDVHLGYGD